MISVWEIIKKLKVLRLLFVGSEKICNFDLQSRLLSLGIAQIRIWLCSRLIAAFNAECTLHEQQYETQRPEKTHQLPVRRTAGRMYGCIQFLGQGQQAGRRERDAQHHEDAGRLDLPPLARRARQHKALLQKDEGGHAEAYRRDYRPDTKPLK